MYSTHFGFPPLYPVKLSALMCTFRYIRSQAFQNDVTFFSSQGECSPHSTYSDK